MCNCGNSNCGSCECSNSYRVSTGAVGPTGATGATGPAGPAGESSFLYSIAYSSGLPSTTVAAGYETLGTYTMAAGEMASNYDVVIAKARLVVVSADQTAKNIRFTFGGVNYNPEVITTIIGGFGLSIVDMEMVIERVSATSQTVNIRCFEGWSNLSKALVYTTGVVNLANTAVISIQAEAEAASPSLVSLSSFNIQKIIA